MLYYKAKECLDRFCASIGQQEVLNMSTDLIRSSIQSLDWKMRHTGYSYLSIISEACAQAFDDNLDEVLKLAGSGVVDEHLRVRVAGLE